MSVPETHLHYTTRAMKNKPDYAKMFSYDAKRGLYYCKRTINGTPKQFHAKDPEELYHRVQAALEPPEPTFADVMREWSEHRLPSLSPNTQDTYGTYINRLLEEFGNTHIADIIPADVERVILRMASQGYAAQTVNIVRNILTSVFNYAITMPAPPITMNPASAVSLPRNLPRKKRSAPPDDVLDAILRSTDAPFALFALTLVYTGCRKGEALALTWGDIDFQRGTISITKQYTYPGNVATLSPVKTASGNRVVPLLDGLRSLLVPGRPSDLIFGGPYTPGQFSRLWRDYCVAIGQYETVPQECTIRGKRVVIQHKRPTLTPHQLRHAYATILYEADVDSKTAQSLMGHSDIHTTLQIYTDIRNSHRDEETRKINDYVNRMVNRDGEPNRENVVTP